MATKRKHHKRQRHHRKIRGGGWTDTLPMINPGNLTHQPYGGPFKDCAGTPVRPGTLSGPNNGTGGLPGFTGVGGKRRRTRHHRHRRHSRRGHRGGGPAPFATAFSGSDVFHGPMPRNNGYIMTEAQTGPGKAVLDEGFRGYTTGASAELAQTSPAPVMGGGRRRGRGRGRRTMKGGRYGMDPGMGPLNPSNGVGTTPGPFGRVKCETGTYNPLNPNPGGIQTMSTAQGWVPGWTHYIDPVKQMFGMKGGRRRGSRRPSRCPSRRHRGGGRDTGGIDTYTVGGVDSMRYYSPTAGYSNLPMNPTVPNNPGILQQIGYPAGHFNSACIKTN